MNAVSSPNKPSEKRAFLPGLAVSIFHVLRLYWLTELALLVVVVFGLRSGWSAPKQWSDGFFFAASAQVLIAAVFVFATPAEALDASWLRYVTRSDISETRSELLQGTLRRKKFGLRVLLGALLTFLIAGVVVWI